MHQEKKKIHKASHLKAANTVEEWIMQFEALKFHFRNGWKSRTTESDPGLIKDFKIE